MCDKTNFCALFLCVVYDGTIYDHYLRNEDNRYQLEQIFEVCGINRGIPTNFLIEQLNSLQGTYLETTKTDSISLYKGRERQYLEPELRYTIRCLISFVFIFGKNFTAQLYNTHIDVLYLKELSWKV